MYRKGNNTGSDLRHMRHTLSDNRHSLIVNAIVTTADGYAERDAAKAMTNDARQALTDPQRELTLGAENGYDVAEFVRMRPPWDKPDRWKRNKEMRSGSH